MLARHKDVFFSVAGRLNCWIGLREPNPMADKWVGRPGYIAKSEKCKAKTADNQAFRFAGLVVNPLLCPEAFTAATVGEALKKWEGFTVVGRLPAGFTCAGSGHEKGLLKYQGAAIHADYDLMNISRADKNGKFAFTSENEELALFNQARPLLNAGFGAEMIQHGTEFSWTDGVGAREREQVLYFGPNRKFMQATSSMPQGAGSRH